MSTDSEDRAGAARWALPTSVALHFLAIVLLIFGLPISQLRPEKEQAVSVDLVPPPKQPEPRAPPPPQPAAAQPPKQPRAQPPKPPKQPETTAKKPPEPPESAPQRKPIPVLDPVHRFGEKDAGPKKSEKGESAQNAASASSAQGRPDKQVSASPRALTAPGHAGAASVPPTSPTPSARPANAESGQGDKELHEAKTLYSGSETGDQIATTAMRTVPRDIRAGWLCVTELRDQLEHSAQPYFPQILPSYRLKEGTLMDISQAAFRVAGQWYDLSFRCQIDPGATKVVYFAFRVGDAIPKEEWANRGLPSE
ncbi:MAG: DUF930 domain-containing protein [Rhizobiaceae bacterium]